MATKTKRECKTGFVLSARRVMRGKRPVLTCDTCGVESGEHA